MTHRWTWARSVVLMLACTGSVWLAAPQFLHAQAAEQTDEAQKPMQDSEWARIKTVDVPLSPTQVKKVLIRNDGAKFRASQDPESLRVVQEYRLLMKRALEDDPALESQLSLSKEEVARIRAIYDREAERKKELKGLLKDQYYLWEELDNLNHTLNSVLDELRSSREYYTVKVDLATSTEGIESIEYEAETYLDAKAIIEDVKQGMIKSVTVVASWKKGPAAKRRPNEPDWTVCKRCPVVGFGY